MNSLDKKIDKIVKKYNSTATSTAYILGLCATFDFTEFGEEWNYYWKTINIKNIVL